MNYRLSDIAAICSARLCGEDRVVEGVITDSRSSYVGVSSLFVAMCGVNHNSHDYIKQMMGRGVSAFMVEDCRVVEPSASYIVVDNSIRALQCLAGYHRQSFKGRVVAITGSNGKSVVKEWIAQLMPSGCHLFRSPRSYNSQLGVALSLLKIKGCEELALLEAGVSQQGEMARLEGMISPHIVIFTSIGEAHQEGFESIEQKISEKLELAKGAEYIIYNSEYCELHDFITNHASEFSAEIIDVAALRGGDFSDIASRRNSKLIEALFSLLGLEKPDFRGVQPIAMRLDVREGLNNSLIINDSYNSDLDSLIIALDYLNSMSSSRATTLVLSAILQSGAPLDELYRDVAKAIERSGVDKLICVGDELRRYGGLFSCEKEFYDTTEELLMRLNRADFAGRALLLKGNRASRFERIMHALESKSHTTTLEVNLDVMLDNLNYFRARIDSKCKIMAMVKAFGYGCGDYEAAQMFTAQGVDYLAVAFADEGIALREKGVTTPIVVLNADDGSYDKMVSYSLEPEIYSLRSLRDFIAVLTLYGEREYAIHLKLDSGMHRLGFTCDELPELVNLLEECGEQVRVASIFTHLSSSDVESEREFTQSQIDSFERDSSLLIDHLGYAPLRHVVATNGVINYPNAHYDMVRLGIGLYGLQGGDLLPVTTLKSRIVQIKSLKAGESIGYGRSAILERDSVIATVPIGYADGLRRKLGGGAWSFIVGGAWAPTVGRVCMDSVMIDITDIEGVEQGDEVVILSPQRGNRPLDMARVLDTISYEVITSISTRVKRVYIKE